MYNDYLQILGLTTGASEQDIKNAYRRLAKQYHPDINKSEEARHKFIEVTEAYKFLTDIGPRPNQEYITYDYNPYQEKYDQWRENAKAYARKRAEEEAANQQNLLNKLFYYFNYFTVFVLVLNSIIIADIILPAQAHQERVIGVSELHFRQSPYSGLVHMYDEVVFTNFKFRVEKNAASGIEDNKALVYTSPVLNFIKYAEVEFAGGVKQLFPEYGIYYIFRILIPLIIIFCVAYFFLSNLHVNKVTVLVVIAVLSLMEIAMILSFNY